MPVLVLHGFLEQEVDHVDPASRRARALLLYEMGTIEELILGERAWSQTVENLAVKRGGFGQGPGLGRGCGHIRQIRRGRRAFDRFVQEARLSSSIDHPGIVRTFDLGVTQEGIPYIVMAYLPGGSVDDLIAEGPLSLDETREYISHRIGAAGAKRRPLFEAGAI